MPKFRYRAIDNAGRLVKASAIAAGDRELEAKLSDKGLTLVSSQLHTDGLFSKSLLGDRIGTRDI